MNPQVILIISQKYDNMKEIWSHVFLQKLPQDNQNKAKSTPALRVKLSWRARFQTQLETEPTREESSFASKRYNGGDEVIVWLCSPQSRRNLCHWAGSRKCLCYWSPFSNTHSKWHWCVFCCPSVSHHELVTLLANVPAGCAAARAGHAEPGVRVLRPNWPSARCFLYTHSPNAPPAPVLSWRDVAPRQKNTLFESLFCIIESAKPDSSHMCVNY